MSELEKYICAQVASILRAPSGILKHPFIVPGGIFHDEQSRIVDGILEETLEDVAKDYERIYEQQVPLMRYLARSRTMRRCTLRRRPQGRLRYRTRRTLPR